MSTIYVYGYLKRMPQFLLFQFSKSDSQASPPLLSIIEMLFVAQL